MDLEDTNDPGFRFRLPDASARQLNVDREGARPHQQTIESLLAAQEAECAKTQRQRFQTVAKNLDTLITVGKVLHPEEIPIIRLLHGEFWAVGGNGLAKVGPFLLKGEYPHPAHNQFTYIAHDGAPRQFLEALKLAVNGLGYHVTVRNKGMGSRPEPYIVLVPWEEV